MSIFSINAISQPKKTELIKARRRMLRYSLITECYVTIFVIAQVSFTSLYTSLLSDLIHNTYSPFSFCIFLCSFHLLSKVNREMFNKQDLQLFIHISLSVVQHALLKTIVFYYSIILQQMYFSMGLL